jgi:cleavage and polyadenylation specificity factor subunit 1
VLSLAEDFSVKNLRDFTFLPGFNTPTLAMLFSPHQTWAGRYGALRDTFQLEIRTFDAAAGYPLLTSVKGLPADCLYMVTAPADIGGVIVVTETGIIHVDQAGRIAASSVSGWWRHVTMLRANNTADIMKMSLLGSKAAFVEKELVLVLADGSAYQVKLEMDGRAVGSILVQPKMALLPPPSSICVQGHAMFVGCAEGDSVLYNVDLVRDSLKEDVKPDIEMDADEDGQFSFIYHYSTDIIDLYADANPIQANGLVPSGPARVELKIGDTLSGIGKIIDMEFGIASTDQGIRTYPQLVAISGGSRQSTFNVFRRGIPINKRRRFNELATADRVWFLPIQRAAGQRLRDVAEEERTTMLLSSEMSQTRVSISHPFDVLCMAKGRLAGTYMAGLCTVQQGKPRANRSTADADHHGCTFFPPQHGDARSRGGRLPTRCE